MTPKSDNNIDFKSQFLEMLHSPQQLKRLYEYLPDVYFFAKNRESQFVMANKIFIEKCGMADETQIIGKTDLDFFPIDRARTYMKDDSFVVSTGKDIIDKVELAPEIDGSINWFITCKVPLYSKDNEIIGLAGIARDCQKAQSAFNRYFEMNNVIEYIRDHYHEPIEVKKLANLSNLSVSQFERKFKKTFQTSPVKHITQVRINAACQALSDTNDTISKIALECGFYDHSHFTRHFRNIVGMNPKVYRKTH